MIKISIVTDEISSDFETAVEIGTEWGIHDFELRGYGTVRVPMFSEYQKQRVDEICAEYQAQIVAISPGLFKIPYPGRERERFPLEVIDHGLYQKWKDARSLLDYHRSELLPASLEYAVRVHAKRVVIFSFARSSQPQNPIPDEIVECLHPAAEQAAKAGLELVIEVEDGYWADTGSHTAELVRRVNHPSLGVNWDAGNACAAGDVPFPDGYQAVREYVKHVHFKDLIHSVDGSSSYAIEGEIDWEGQIKALARVGYDGYISVEPHMRPKVANSRKAYQRLVKLIKESAG
jgi:sugar phosphate isomerase/epimerase